MNWQLFTPTYMLGLACAYELSRRLCVEACLKGCETIRYHDSCEEALTSASQFGFGSTCKNAQKSEQRNAQSRNTFANPGQELQSVFGCFLCFTGMFGFRSFYSQTKNVWAQQTAGPRLGKFPSLRGILAVNSRRYCLCLRLRCLRRVYGMSLASLALTGRCQMRSSRIEILSFSTWTGQSHLTSLPSESF